MGAKGENDDDNPGLDWYKRAFDESQMGMVLVDSNWKFVEVNKAFCKILGYTQHELLEKTLVEVTSPDDLARSCAKMQKMFAGTTSTAKMEVCYLTKAGDRLCCLVSASTMGKDAKGRPRFIFMVLQDITTRKRLETVLKENESNYHTLVEMLPDPVVVHADGKVVFANRATLALLGVKSMKQVVGKPTLSFVHADSLAAVKQRIVKMLETGERAPLFREKFVRLDGSVVDVEVVAQPIVYKGKRAIQVAIHDVSETKKILDALQKSGELYRALTEAANDMVYVLDKEDRVVYVNSYAAKQFGVKPADIIGKKRTDLFRREEALGQGLSISKVFEKGEPLYVEEKVRFRTKETWIGTWLVPLRNGEGEVDRIMGVSRDITAQRQAEEELFNSRQMLQLVLDNIPQRIFWKDRDSVYLGCNKLLAQDAGYADPSELIGKTDFETASATTAERYRADDKEVMETDRSKLDYEEPQVKPDGSSAWLRTSKVPLHDKDGQVIAVLGMYEDITERKKAEEELKHAKEFSEQLIDSLPGMYYLMDKEGKFWRWNDNFIKVGGYSIEEVNRMAPPDFFVAEEHDLIAGKIREVFEKGHVEVEVTLLTKGGKRLPYLMTGTRVKIRDQMMLSGVGIDISDRKKAEGELLVANKKIEKDLMALEEFTMIASHEMRAPMTAIKWQITSILEGTYGALGETLKAPLGGILVSTDRLIHLVNDMISLSRLESGIIRYNYTDLDLKELTKDIIATFVSEARNKGIGIVTEGLVVQKVRVDSDKVAQILSNMIDNAIKYTPFGGKVTVTCGVSGDKFSVVVADTGVGISDDFKAKLFGKFVTANEGNGFKGTGLGLYISRRLAREMGGDLVLVFSEKGKGSTFALRLPLNGELM